MTKRDDLVVGYVRTEVFTTPHATPDLDPEPALLAAIKSAKKSIYFSMYAWTLVDLAQAMIKQHAAGLLVQGVADAGEYGIKNSQFASMHAAGIDMRVWGSQYVPAHEKVLVIDYDTPHPIVTSGSYNFTTSAEKGNKEVLMIHSGIQVGRVLAPTLRDQILATYLDGRPPPTS